MGRQQSEAASAPRVRHPVRDESRILDEIAAIISLTAAVFITKRDYSFLSTALCVGGWVALGLIAASLIFGFSLGLLFSFGMVALASGYIIYYTSNVLHHYRTDQHVAAALALFAAVALLFWYILQIVMRSRD